MTTTNENKVGCKKTKLGWIPEDWIQIKLGEKGSFLKGKGISKNEILESGFPCIRYGEIYTHHNEYIKSFRSFIQRKSADESTKMYCGDILFAASGETLEEIGKCVAFVDEYDAYAGGDIIIWRDHQQNPKFLGYLFNTSVFTKQTYKLGQGNAVVHIYSSGLGKVTILLPPLPEQQKIATILSTWDKAIEKLTQLIAAKEQRKKGLMQLLLTGKKRFAGFTEEWKEVKLGEIITIGSSKRVLQEDWLTEGVPFIRTREVINLSNGENFKTPIFISEGLFSELKNKYGIPKPGDLLVTGVGTIGATYIVKETDKFYFKDGNVLWFKMNDKINSMFLHQMFKTRFIRKQLSDNATITTVSTFTIDGARGTTVLLPSINEQQKIASTLSAADKEIELLKQELSNLQQEKKGLMQKLLTGEVRVKIN